MNRPPKMMQTMLGVLLPPDRREQVLGDLEEEYRLAPRSQALWYYLWDVLALLPPILGRQVGAWFAMGPAAPGLTIGAGAEVVREQVERFQRDNHSRVTFYFTMCAALMTFFAWMSTRTTVWTPRLFLAAFTALLAFTAWQHYRRGSGRVVPAEASLNELIDFHRRALERRREFLLTLWYWKFVPLILPLLAATAMKRNYTTFRDLVTIVCGFAVTYAAARRQVRALDQRIAELR